MSRNGSDNAAWADWRNDMLFEAAQLASVNISTGSLKQRVAVLNKYTDLLLNISQSLKWLRKYRTDSNWQAVALHTLQQPHSLLLTCLRLLTDLQAAAFKPHQLHSTDAQQLLKNQAFNALCGIYTDVIRHTARIGCTLAYKAQPKLHLATWTDPSTSQIVCDALLKGGLLLCDKRLALKDLHALALCELLERNLRFARADRPVVIQQLLSSNYLAPLCCHAQAAVLASEPRKANGRAIPDEIEFLVSLLLSVIAYSGPLPPEQQQQQLQLQHSIEVSSLALTLARQLMKEKGAIDGSRQVTVMWVGVDNVELHITSVAGMIAGLLDALLLCSHSNIAGRSSTSSSSTTASSGSSTRSAAATLELAEAWVELHKWCGLYYMWPPVSSSAQSQNSLPNLVASVPTDKRARLAYDIAACILTTMESAARQLARLEPQCQQENEAQMAQYIMDTPILLYWPYIDKILTKDKQHRDKLFMAVCWRGLRALRDLLWTEAGPAVARHLGTRIVSTAERVVRLLPCAELLQLSVEATMHVCWHIDYAKYTANTAMPHELMQVQASLMVSLRKRLVLHAQDACAGTESITAASAGAATAASCSDATESDLSSSSSEPTVGATSTTNISAPSEACNGATTDAQATVASPETEQGTQDVAAGCSNGAPADLDADSHPVVAGSEVLDAAGHMKLRVGNIVGSSDSSSSGVPCNAAPHALQRLLLWLPACQHYLLACMKMDHTAHGQLRPETCSLWLCLSSSILKCLRELSTEHWAAALPLVPVSLAPTMAGMLKVTIQQLDEQAEQPPACVLLAQQAACEALLACLRLTQSAPPAWAPGSDAIEYMGDLLDALHDSGDCLAAQFDRAVQGELCQRLEAWGSRFIPGGEEYERYYLSESNVGIGSDAISEDSMGSSKGLEGCIKGNAQGSSTATAPAEGLPVVLPGMPSRAMLHPTIGCWHLGCTCLSGSSESSLPTHRCRGCKVARYCSLDCHNQDWAGGHGRECRQLRAKRRMQRRDAQQVKQPGT